jgi:hypothetical protein
MVSGWPRPRTSPAASVTSTPGGGFVLQLPAGDSRAFRLAQLDDYVELPRRSFRWDSPVSLSLRARLSAQSYAGTWGFGLWNDPFTLSLGVRGTARRLPALPNAAWFFFASEPNHLALRDDRPGGGFLAATFSSARVPAPLLAPGLLALPLLAWEPSSRWLRHLAARFVGGDSKRLEADPSDWLEYRLRWGPVHVGFDVGGEPVFETDVAPRGPLGLVIWMDNQFAAWRPDGSAASGLLAGTPATLEIEDLQVRRES